MTQVICCRYEELERVYGFGLMNVAEFSSEFSPARLEEIRSIALKATEKARKALEDRRLELQKRRATMQQTKDELSEVLIEMCRIVVHLHTVVFQRNVACYQNFITKHGAHAVSMDMQQERADQPALMHECSLDLEMVCRCVHAGLFASSSNFAVGLSSVLNAGCRATSSCRSWLRETVRTREILCRPSTSSSASTLSFSSTGSSISFAPTSRAQTGPALTSSIRGLPTTMAPMAPALTSSVRGLCPWTREWIEPCLPERAHRHILIVVVCRLLLIVGNKGIKCAVAAMVALKTGKGLIADEAARMDEEGAAAAFVCMCE